jgi:heme/copper-type cytochrome/quinol oxidase subunit 2
MKIDAANIETDRNTSGNFWRWLGILLPAASWGIQLQSVYLTSEHGCQDLDYKWNHIVSASAMLLAIVGGLIAWSLWPAGNYSATKEEGKPVVRQQFMGIIGIALSILFTFVIFAQWLPTLTGVPCGK